MLLPTAERNAMAEAWKAQVAIGSGTALCRILSAGAAAVLAEFALPNPAFDVAGTVAAGQLTLQGVPISTTGEVAAGAGTAAAVAHIIGRNGTLRGSGNVGLTGSGAFCTLDNLNIAEDQVARLTGGTFVMPAGAL